MNTTGNKEPFDFFIYVTGTVRAFPMVKIIFNTHYIKYRLNKYQ